MATHHGPDTYVIDIEFCHGDSAAYYQAHIRKAGIHKSILASGIGSDVTQAILQAAKQLAGEDTTPWHTPTEEQKNCVLCGVTIFNKDERWVNPNGRVVEVAEMHGDLKPMYGTSDIQVNGGFVHAQCGITAGWSVS